MRRMVVGSNEHRLFRRSGGREWREAFIAGRKGALSEVSGGFHVEYRMEFWRFQASMDLGRQSCRS